MDIVLKIILALITAICFLGGFNLMTKGTKSYLPDNVPAQQKLDNLFRFLSGIYFGFGFLMLWATFHSNHAGDLLYFIGIIVLFSGLGRLYSRIKVGSPGVYYDAMMVLEIILGITINLIQYFGH